MQTFDFDISYEDLNISFKDIEEIAPEESKGMEDFVIPFNQIIYEGKHFIDAKGGYRIMEDFECGDTTICIGETIFETGKIIARQFRKAEKIAIFACTAGPGVRETYDRYMSENDPLKAFMTDTLGTVGVEKAMDIIHANLEQELQKDGLHCTNRYSPGYCGWLVSEQQKLWKFLPKDYCGIKLTESSLMLPIKSVSGIIGIGGNVRKAAYSCAICDLNHCIYRRKKTH